jgi:hypothetical protein
MQIGPGIWACGDYVAGRLPCHFGSRCSQWFRGGRGHEAIGENTPMPIEPRFAQEPAYTHGQLPVLPSFTATSAPQTHPPAPALRRYLAEFLSDPEGGRSPVFYGC